MALTPSHIALIKQVRNLSKNELEMEGRILQADVLWNGSPDMHTTMSDAELEERYPEAGLTNTVLGDAIFGLKLLALGGSGAGIANCKTALTILANLPEQP